MNQCQTGHNKHDTLKVETEVGPMWVYDYEKYKDAVGYCTGKDDISRTLSNEGVWEKEDLGLIKDILAKGNKDKLVIDIGSHIGWYSILAGQFDYLVTAIDGDRENLDTLRKNARLNKVEHRVMVQHEWISGRTPKKIPPITAELLKIDIEGNEIYAVDIFNESLKNKTIENLFIEFTPVFNNSYPEIYRRLTAYGYQAFKGGESWNGELNFDQANILFKL